MKIVDGRTTVVETPWRELTFVEVETDDGLVGTGEVRMVNKRKALVACIEALEGLLRASRLMSISGYPARIGAIDDVIDQHARIFERVRERDSKGAADAMRAHLRTTEQDLRAAMFLNRGSDEGDE